MFKNKKTVLATYVITKCSYLWLTYINNILIQTIKTKSIKFKQAQRNSSYFTTGILHPLKTSRLLSKYAWYHWFQYVHEDPVMIKDILSLPYFLKKFTTTTTTPKQFPLMRGVRRSRCTQSYPYTYKTHREIVSNKPTENSFF